MEVINKAELIDALRDRQKASECKHSGLKESALIDAIISLVEDISKPLSEEEINLSIKKRIERANEEARKKSTR